MGLGHQLFPEFPRFVKYLAFVVKYTVIKMPPKKKGEEAPKQVIMGRMGSTNLRVGIVGLPNVGKSTFFNVITKSAIPAENFPFCTIEPNESRVAVPDARFDFLCDHHKPASKVPAWLNIMDIAGLVSGASEGQGLGNAFLSHIKECDAIFHMLRTFDGDDVTHVEGDVNPVRDMEIIHNELRLKDMEYVRKALEKLEKTCIRGNDKSQKGEYDVLVKVRKLLEEDKKPVRFASWDNKEIEDLNKHLLLTSKPMVYLLNLSEKDYIRKKNKWLVKIKEYIDANDPGSAMIPFSGALETDLIHMSEEEREAYLKEKNTSGALDKIIVTGYKVLGLIYFFTAGADEVKAWTIQRGYKAPQAAGKIHTDMEKGFIMAEVMGYNDFKEAGSEAATKAAGKYKMKGKDYVVEDGDIIFFKFNAGAGLTGKKK